MSTKTNRKYYLHQKIKHLFRYSSKRKIIIATIEYNGGNKDVEELQSNYNYSVQYIIE